MTLTRPLFEVMLIVETLRETIVKVTWGQELRITTSLLLNAAKIGEMSWRRVLPSAAVFKEVWIPEHGPDIHAVASWVSRLRYAMALSSMR